jgi:hypothetical protein
VFLAVFLLCQRRRRASVGLVTPSTPFLRFRAYQCTYVCRVPLLKRTWSLVGAYRGLIAVDGVRLSAWRDYNDFANETDNCSDLVASPLGSARMRAMLKSKIGTMALLRIRVSCEFD